MMKPILRGVGAITPPHDPIIEVKGDIGTLDAQFVVFNIVGVQRPAGGWPAGASGAQGTITPIESGYYRPILKKVDGRWMMAHHRIYLDPPDGFLGEAI